MLQNQSFQTIYNSIRVFLKEERKRHFMLQYLINTMWPWLFLMPPFCHVGHYNQSILCYNHHNVSLEDWRIFLCPANVKRPCWHLQRDLDMAPGRKYYHGTGESVDYCRSELKVAITGWCTPLIVYWNKLDFMNFIFF